MKVMDFLSPSVPLTPKEQEYGEKLAATLTKPVESKPEAKTETKVEPKTETKTEVKSEPKAEAKSGTEKSG